MAIIQGGSAGGFAEPADLKLDFKDMVLDGKNIDLSKYGPSNPHPGFGKDPNILNEYGHTVYPKMVYPESKPSGIIVNSKEEEDAAMAPPASSVPQTNQNNGWGNPAK